MGPERRNSPTSTSSPWLPSAKTGVKEKLVEESMGVARGEKTRPSTAAMAISLPSGMSWSAMVSTPAAGSGREVRTMERSVPPVARKSSAEKEMAPVTGPFLEKAATAGGSSTAPKRAAAGRVKARAEETARAITRWARVLFKVKTSLLWVKKSGVVFTDNREAIPIF